MKERCAFLITYYVKLTVPVYDLNREALLDFSDITVVAAKYIPLILSSKLQCQFRYLTHINPQLSYL